MILEKLDENVYYYKNVILDPQKLVSEIEDTENFDDIVDVVPKWNEWSACSGKMYVYGNKKNLFPEKLITLSPDLQEKSLYIINTIKNAMQLVCEDWANQKGIQDSINISPFIGINKYMEGTFMGGHFDQQEGDTRLKYSLVMYLNDNYEGGEISFTIKDGILDGDDRPHEDFSDPLNKGKYSFGIKPEAGSVLIFPSSPPYSHTAHLIKSGSKYMVPGFWMNNEM